MRAHSLQPPCLMLLSFICCAAVGASAEVPLASILTQEELGRVRKGEILVRRSSSRGRVETVVAARIDAPPSWVYAQMRDACHLKQATEYSSEPRYVSPTQAEAALAALKTGELTRASVEKLDTIPCEMAMASSISFSNTPWHLPWPLPDGWSFSRGVRTPVAESGGTIRVNQLAGSLSHLEYTTEITPLDGNTLFVAVSVFAIPFSVPDFMLGSTDQSSRHVTALRERAKSMPWKTSR